MNQNVRSILLAIVLIGGCVWAGSRFYKVARPSANNADFPDGVVWYCPQEEKEFAITMDELAAWIGENGDAPYPCPSCGSKETYRPQKARH